MPYPIKFGDKISVGDLSKGAKDYSLKIEKKYFSSIAERLGIHSMKRLTAAIVAEDFGRQIGVKLTGNIEAIIEQICVVSLEPFENNVQANLNLRLVSGDELERLDAVEAYLDPEFDEYDALEGGMIDLCDIAVQTISMEIDPYAHNQSIEDLSINNKKLDINAPPIERQNPFAALEKLKNKS